MGGFTSLKTRCEMLSRAMGDRKAIPLADAAAAMEIRENQVARMLLRMCKRDFFAPLCPYVDDALHYLVLDPSFAPHAELVAALTALRQMIASALQALARLAPMRGDKSRAVGSFLQRVVDASLSGKDAGKILRNETGSLVRDLFTPVDRQPSAPAQHCQRVLTALDATCAEALSVAEAYPLARSARELALSAHALRRAVGEMYNGLQAGRIQQLSGEVQQSFTRRAAAFCASAAAPVSDADMLLNDLDAQREALRARAQLLRSKEAREALAIINALLLDIFAQLRQLDPDLHMSAIRSLRVSYLPMLRELIEKQLQYELLPAPDAAATQAMAESISVLKNDIPEAFNALLTDLRASSAMDLEAHSEALRRKLQLDGLIDAF